MSEELKADDFGAAWRDQPQEERAVNMDDFVGRRTRELHASSRAETVMSIGAALLFMVVVPWRLAAEMGRVPVVGLVAAVVWVLISLYWFRDRIWHKEPAARRARGSRPGILPERAGAAPRPSAERVVVARPADRGVRVLCGDRRRAGVSGCGAAGKCAAAGGATRGVDGVWDHAAAAAGECATAGDRRDQ